MNIKNGNFIPKFVPVDQSKTLISIRLNDLVIQKIDRIANRSNLSRNEVIKQMLDHILENMEDEGEDKE
jgi:metal-responsive CopG/Arc/MetJ family transcriptional regulator